MSKSITDLKKEYKKAYDNQELGELTWDGYILNERKVWSFIEQSIQKSIKERELQLKKDIGFLRQWLNERTSKELVTSKDLENWLLSDLSQK